MSPTYLTREFIMAQFQGYKNWNHWNVALWLGNDEGLYNIASRAMRRASNLDAAAIDILKTMKERGITATPDGVTYTVTTIRSAIKDL